MPEETKSIPCGSSFLLRAERSEREWRVARQRVLAYLDAIGVPAVETLEISMQVIHQARQEISANDDRHPVAAAMDALRQLLRDTNAATGGICRPEAWRNGFGRAIPPLNRGSMTPEEMSFGHLFARAHAPVSGKKWHSLRIGFWFLVFILAMGVMMI